MGIPKKLYNHETYDKPCYYNPEFYYREGAEIVF